MIRVVVAGALAEHAVLAGLLLPSMGHDAFGPALRVALAREAVPALPVEVAG
ncbi:hypothetical protein AB0878_25615 [Amycolatopsis sp. NPDC047767]|uniref:hypothetical protein n=1 Tax=Amycolatopsis sp. NPDC047767 TaxID=3156765 RepID=UPI003456A682